MPVARFRRDGTPTAAAAVRHAATGTPPGWSQRAACRALKTGKRQTGVYAVELRPGGSVRFLLWRGDPGGQAGQTGDVREKARKDSAEGDVDIGVAHMAFLSLRAQDLRPVP